MTEENKEELTQKLLNLGLDDKTIRELFLTIQFPEVYEPMQLIIANIKTDCPTRFDLKFYKEEGESTYTLTGFNGSLIIIPEIDHIYISGINTLLLEQLMASLDWSFDYRHLRVS